MKRWDTSEAPQINSIDRGVHSSGHCSKLHKHDNDQVNRRRHFDVEDQQWYIEFQIVERGINKEMWKLNNYTHWVCCCYYKCLGWQCG